MAYPDPPRKPPKGDKPRFFDGAERSELRLVLAAVIAHAYISSPKLQGSTEVVAAYAMKQAEALLRAAKEFKP